MKKKVLALEAAITLVAPLQSVAFAHENDGDRDLELFRAGLLKINIKKA